MLLFCKIWWCLEFKIITARVRSDQYDVRSVRREGNSFTLFVSSHLGGVRSSQGGQVQPGGFRSSWGGQVQPGGESGPARGEGQVSRGGGRSAGGVRSSRGGGVRSSQGGSASCALLRAVCLLRSRRRTFLFRYNFNNIAINSKRGHHWQCSWSLLLQITLWYHSHKMCVKQRKVTFNVSIMCVCTNCTKQWDVDVDGENR